MRAWQRFLFCTGLLGVAPVASLVAQDDEVVTLDRTPEQCVTVSRIRKTEIVDDESILFYMRSGDIYRNVLPRRCGTLKRQGRFMYEVRGSQLCDVDWITVLEQFGGSLARGMTCALGAFHPITELEAEAFLATAEDLPAGPESFEVKPVELPPDEEDQAPPADTE